MILFIEVEFLQSVGLIRCYRRLAVRLRRREARHSEGNVWHPGSRQTRNRSRMHSAALSQECDMNGVKLTRVAAPALLLILVLMLPCLPALSQVDPSGGWDNRFHEDEPERIPGPEIGDYLGLPINDAARLRGDSWDASLLTLPEHQCKPHPADYGPRGPANMRISKEVDTATQQVIAFHTHISWMATERTIYLDGRPHPPAYAAH